MSYAVVCIYQIALQFVLADTDNKVLLFSLGTLSAIKKNNLQNTIPTLKKMTDGPDFWYTRVCDFDVIIQCNKSFFLRTICY